MSTILGKWSYPYKASNDRKKKQSCLIWRANQIHGSLVSRQQNWCSWIFIPLSEIQRSRRFWPSLTILPIPSLSVRRQSSGWNRKWPRCKSLTPKKIQRLCRTDNLESWTMAIPLWLWWCGDASADATVIFRLIVSMILIMSIVMMMMVVVYQCLLMVINGFWWFLMVFDGY